MLRRAKRRCVIGCPVVDKKEIHAFGNEAFFSSDAFEAMY